MRILQTNQGNFKRILRRSAAACMLAVVIVSAHTQPAHADPSDWPYFTWQYIQSGYKAASDQMSAALTANMNTQGQQGLANAANQIPDKQTAMNIAAAGTHPTTSKACYSRMGGGEDASRQAKEFAAALQQGLPVRDSSPGAEAKSMVIPCQHFRPTSTIANDPYSPYWQALCQNVGGDNAMPYADTRPVSVIGYTEYPVPPGTTFINGAWTFPQSGNGQLTIPAPPASGSTSPNYWQIVAAYLYCQSLEPSVDLPPKPPSTSGTLPLSYLKMAATSRAMGTNSGPVAVCLDSLANRAQWPNGTPGHAAQEGRCKGMAETKIITPAEYADCVANGMSVQESDRLDAYRLSRIGSIYRNHLTGDEGISDVDVAKIEATTAPLLVHNYEVKLAAEKAELYRQAKIAAESSSAPGPGDNPLQ